MPSPKTFQEAESIYDRATKLEFATEFKSAFRLYLDATDAFLHLSRSPVATPAFQAQCKESALKAIQRAEKIKKASKAGAQIDFITVPINPFAPDHQAYVLRKSSTINNVRYPPWDESVPLPRNPSAHYSDPGGQPAIPLSRITSTAISWKSPPGDPSNPQEHSLNLTPAGIEQNIINDCSVCASVAVCVQHNQRFNSRLLFSSLFQGNQPGRYDIKAYLNAIDDLLPYDDTGHPMGISSGRIEVAWPALIEKAYMKLMGGYDFPGSNSSIDLRVLAGWVPEHIDLQSTTFERERTWKRIVNGFRKGHCVLTVGTDAKTTLKIKGVKLLPSHDYAVVDIREMKNERWLTLIDSRIPATSSSLFPEHENSSSTIDMRMLDMRWDDICATFEGVYVSWNPGLFQSGVNFHGVWKPANEGDKAQAPVHYLRLLYECQNAVVGGSDPLHIRKDIWVLLTRHFSKSSRETEYISLTVRPADEEDWRDMWLKAGSAEVKGPYTTSPHVLVRTKAGKEYPTPSSSSTPTKISGALSVLASYDGPFDDVFFTVNVFCGADIKVWWDEAAGIDNSIHPGGCEFSTKVNGALTTKNAGGNHAHPTYMLNPQWRLRIHDDNAALSARGVVVPNGRASSQRDCAGSSKPVGGRVKASQTAVVVLSAQGPREVPLNVTAVWSSGERIVELAQKDVVTSSGAYTYGRARAVGNMIPGDYTIILSAFEPQTHLGQFTLKVESSHRFDLKAIPQEGAGMYTRVSRGEWVEHSAAGGPSHGRYHSNPIYEIQLSSSAKLGARLHLIPPAPAAALNLSLFLPSASTSGIPTLDCLKASSGPYSDALAGVYIPPRVLSPGRYWLVPSTFAAGVLASFQLVVYSSNSGCALSKRP